MRRLLAVSAAISVAAIATMSAHADLLPPGGRPQPREIVVTGTVAALASTQITVNDRQGGERRTIALAGPARIEDLGLRVGDTVAVTMRGFGNPFSAPATSIDRVLPDGHTSIRVFFANQPATPPALAEGQGCWVGARAGENVELCFTSVSRGVALRYRPDGALACTAPLQGTGGRFAAEAASCRDGGSWPVSNVACDGSESCRVTLTGQPEQTLTMTRR